MTPATIPRHAGLLSCATSQRPRRAYRLSWTARLAAWLAEPPAPRRAMDDMTTAARREALR